jgi:hypothetical protein
MWLVDFTLLVLGYIYTLFLPGFLIIQTFYHDLPKLVKLSLIFLISVLISSYNVCFFSLISGYSRATILISVTPFMVWFCYLWQRGRLAFDFIDSNHKVAYYLAILCFFLIFIALYQGIFTFHDNYFVMAGVNWQDTAMHLSIIETISQGNFPPQAPYFSGHPLSYYYFTDLHSSILETLFGHFWPRVLVYDNPFFVTTFCLSVYALAFYLTKRKLTSFFTSILAVFYGNTMFIRFFQDVVSSNTIDLSNIISLLTSKGYTLEFGQLLSVAPMADYFLQNRPMMVGLPAVTLIVFLLFCGFSEKKERYIFLGGLITAMLFGFQMFAFGTGILIFLPFLAIYCGGRDLKSIIRSFFGFFSPLTIFILFFSLINKENQPTLSLLIENFSFGSWDKTGDIFWYLGFYMANFGFLIVLPFVAIIGFLTMRIKPAKELFLVIIWFFLMLVIPKAIKFTIYDWDMYKFFYIMIIPAAILTAILLTKIWQSRFSKILVIFILFINSATSLLTLVTNFLNKNAGYSLAEYQAGLWIRENTPRSSIFVSSPSVHSAISEIGGRPRVLSYIVWPYSHGFNKGEDNVFSRQSDIERLYEQGEVYMMVNKYHINFVYLGPEEINNYPRARYVLAASQLVEEVYNNEGIKIYKVK